MNRILLSLLLLFSFSSALCSAATAIDKDDVILVVGATGKTGKLIVARLVEQGYTVRAMVRDIEKGREILGDNITLVKADLTEKESLVAAMEGIDALVNAAGASFKGTDKATPEWIDYRGTAHLVDIASKNTLKKFVLVSSMGATQKDHVLNDIGNNVLIWKFKGEQALRDSSINYSIVRPGGLLDKSPKEQQVQFFQGDKKEGGSIVRDDVARVCIAALLLAQADRKTYEVVSVDGKRNTDFSARFSALSAD